MTTVFSYVDNVDMWIPCVQNVDKSLVWCGQVKCYVN